MKKFISLLVCVAIFCSLSMTGFAAASGCSFSLVPSATTVKAGDTFTVSITTPETTLLTGGGWFIKYDGDLVTVDTSDEGVKFASAWGSTESMLEVDGFENHVLLIASGSGKKVSEIVNVKFIAKADGVAKFELFIDDISGVEYNGSMYSYTEDFEIENTSVTIGGSTPEPPVVEEKFEISATKDGNNVVVSAANVDKAVGEEIKVYVATYAGGVLVNCQEQALVEGTMTFTGLADASARVFVWDKYNVPVADVTIQ